MEDILNLGMHQSIYGRNSDFSKSSIQQDMTFQSSEAHIPILYWLENFYAEAHVQPTYLIRELSWKVTVMVTYSFS